MPYLFETHFHTPVTSHCSKVPAEEAVPAYKKAGYSGICVTDHYYKDWFYEARFDGKKWSEKTDVWLDGYRSAVKAAEGLDMSIILGLEIRFTDNMNDHLVYGVTEELLRENPELYNMSVAEFKAFAEENGLFFAQAHPFRSICSPRNPKHLHGVEIYNGNYRHQSHNETALEFAKSNSLVQISGSDFHMMEDLGRGGIYLEKLPQNSAELAKMLLDNKVCRHKITE